MHDDDVPLGEMRWFRPHRDEIDAVLGDDPVLDDDLIDVAAIVHDLRSVYLSDDRLPRHDALAAFTGAHLDDNGEPLVTAASNAHGSAPQMAGLPNRAPETEGHRSMKKALTAVTAGVAGKIVLGAAVAAASVGGLHATEVVDFPGLPDQASEQAVEATERAFAQEGEGEELSEPEGTEELEEIELEEGPEEQSAFSVEMEMWSECVDAASAQRDIDMETYDASVDGPPGRFDPEAECGERPRNPNASNGQGPPPEVQEFLDGMDAWHECRRENGPQSEECVKPTPPGQARAGETEGSEPETAPQAQPEGTPQGPPEGTPQGPPEGVPQGPPEGTPGGPPEGVPQGPPEGTPGGPPEGEPGS